MVDKDVWNTKNMLASLKNRTTHENKPHNKRKQRAASLVLEDDGDGVRELVQRDHVVRLLIVLRLRLLAELHRELLRAGA